MTPPTPPPASTPPGTDLTGPGTFHVVDLTDEQLLGLDGPASPHVAPLPWLGGRTAEETALAAEVGLRSLMAHGGADGADISTLQAADFSTALDLRDDARTLVFADHSTPTAQETRLLYVHPHVVLTEHVNAAGLHRFFVGDLDSALADLAQWAEPHHHDGAMREIDTDLPPELQGLQAVVFLDIVTLVEDGVDTSSLTFYRLADGQAVEACDDDPTRLQLEPLAGDDILRRLHETIPAPA